MTVVIIPVTDDQEYTVNGHLVYKNQLNNWTCRQDLSNVELTVFSKYEEIVINNKAFKKHPKSTFKA